MTAFDPSAATAAYLGALPPALRRAAEADTLWAHWLAVLIPLLVLAVCWAALRSGLLVQTARRYGRDGAAPWLASAVCAGLFSAVLLLACAPLEAFGAWRAHQGAAPSLGGLAQLAARALRRDVLLIGAAVVILPAVQALMRRAPRSWALWIGAVLAAAVFAVTWAPYALASGPADLPPVPPGAARDGLARLVRDTGIPVSGIYLSNQEARDADVTGLPGQARVVVSKGLWSQATPAQIRAAVGHLMGHYVHGDELSLALVLALLTLGGPLAIWGLFAPAARILGARGLEGPGDAAGLPVPAAIAAIYLCVATVGFNNFIRLVNVRADQYSLDHAREPDGLATNLLRDWHDDRVDPSALEEAVFYDHPSLRSRIDHAMRWKAAHLR